MYVLSLEKTEHLQWVLRAYGNRMPTPIGVWCNGSTTDFGSVREGSNPSTLTILGVGREA